MDDHSSQGVKWAKVLGWVLSLAAVGLVLKLLWQVDPDVWRRLRHVRPGMAILSLGIFQAWFLLRFLCWEIITSRYGISDERATHLRMWTLSELMRYVPGNVWSFAARYQGARQRGGSRGSATVSLLIEAINLTAGAGFITAIFLQPDFWAVWILGAVIYVIGIPFVIRAIAQWRHWEFSSAVKYPTIVVLFFISCLLWLIYGLAQATLIKALPDIVTPHVLFLVGANVAAWLIGYISIITPMGLGVREVTLVSFLATSVAKGVAGVVAVLTRVWMIIAELVFLGLVLLFSRKK